MNAAGEKKPDSQPFLNMSDKVLRKTEGKGREKKMIKHICFDLDGTLVDSKTTILESTKAALDKLKIPHDIPEEIFNNMIGKHFVDIFIELKMDTVDFEQFITIYKALYFDFIDSSYLYPGVTETLKLLNEKNIKVSLLTTKVQEQADKIINHFGLRSSFDYVMGRREGLQHKPSPEPLLFIYKELQVDPDETLMVGDTELDIQCGKNASAKTCGVTYGYRNKEQIEKEKPDFIISDFTDLIEVLD
jgi:phosphoglycolate phosphatase/pyrophosphatase PpaX